MSSTKKKKQNLFNEKRDNGLSGKILFNLYKINNSLVRKITIKLIYTIIGKYCQFYSKTFRRILKEFYGVEIGMYTNGCFVPGNMAPGTKIGRYCSITPTAAQFNGNHPSTTRSTHGFFFDLSLGYVTKDIISPVLTKLVIENDVYIGHNAIILPSCSHIGNGAIIAAGAVVNKDIPPYAIYVGNPGRIVKYRFENETINQLLEQKWWEKSIDELLPEIDEFQKPIDSEVVR